MCAAVSPKAPPSQLLKPVDFDENQLLIFLLSVGKKKKACPIARKKAELSEVDFLIES